MPPILQILDAALRRIKQADTPNSGNLYGIIYEGKTLIVGFSFETDIESPTASTKSFFDAAHVLYPTGIDFCGMIQIGGKSIDVELDPISPPILKKMKDVSVTNNPIYISKSIETGDLEVYYLHGDRLFTTEYTQLTYSEFKQTFIYLRLLGGVSVLVYYESPDDHHIEMEKLSERIAGGMVFRVSESTVYVYKVNFFNNLISTIGKVYDFCLKHKDLSSDMEVLNIYAFFPSSIGIKDSKCITAPFVVDTSCDTNDAEFPFTLNLRHETLKLNIPLPFDGLCVVHRERRLNDVYSLLIDTCERIVFLCETQMSRYIEDPIQLRNMKTFHFFNNVLYHPLSLIFIQDESDNELEEYKSLDITLLVEGYPPQRSTGGIFIPVLNLPFERPYFRRGNGLKFLHPDYLTQVLVNIHDGVRYIPPRSYDHLRACVYGKYGYYHYMMGGINDVGWGNAYRTFQTIFSWFRMQGYTEDEVPSHSEIQKTLVDTDMEISVGSKKRIGAFEIAGLLDSKLDVDSRILFMFSGLDLPKLAPLLMEHFETHGTPVMIAGGVLAYTIIGVSLDKESGAAYYLVLDPHYTGENDESAIQKNRCVGWRSVRFLEPTTPYNLCLPQRPICF